MAILDRSFSHRLEPYLCSFLKLMTKRGHAASIPACLVEYERLWYENSGIVIAEVTTAIPLCSSQKSRLLAKLEAHVGKAVEMRCSVDSTLLGGVSVTINGRLLEGSVSGRLTALRERLDGTTL